MLLMKKSRECSPPLQLAGVHAAYEDKQGVFATTTAG